MKPFFISYARMDHARRVDPDERLGGFYEDLNGAVLHLLGANWSNGFFDVLTLNAGDQWNQGIVDALQAARVFIPLYTANYFLRPVCGQEWTVFRRRQAAFREQFPADPVPNPVLPVLWMPEPFLPPLPPVAATLNYTLAQAGLTAEQHRRLMDEYRQNGMYRIMNMARLRRAYYQDLIALLADAVAQLVRAAELPRADVPDLNAVEDAFATGGPGGRGPRHVKFIYVAAARDDLKGIREEREAYGEEGMYWRPYRPDEDDEVSVLAQEVAARQKFFYETVPFETTVQQVLANARARKNLAVMVVDPFALRISRYYQPVRACDERDDLNFLVMIPWNEADPETRSQREMLERALSDTFRKRPAFSRMYLNAVPTANAFREQLGQTLEWLRTFGGEAPPPGAAPPAPAGGGGPRGLPVLSAAGEEGRR